MKSATAITESKESKESALDALQQSFASDITQRKRADEALRESQERIAGIINSAMDAIITVDANQNVILFNAAAEQMFDYSASEVLGQSLDRFIPERFRSTHHKNILSFGRSREESDIVESYQLGINSYIVKPVDFEHFSEAMRNFGLYWLLVNQPPFLQ